MLICFEGIDGSGKSTVAKRIAGHINTQTLEFPDRSTPSGKLIDEYLKGKWAIADEGQFAILPRHNAIAFQALQVANRMEHMATLYHYRNNRPNLVLARYWQSGWVYGQLDGLEPHWLWDVHRAMAMPNISILVEVSPVVAMDRRVKRDGSETPERYEGKMRVAEETADLYRKLWDNPPFGSGPHVRINGDVDIETVTTLALDAIYELLPEVKPR